MHNECKTVKQTCFPENVSAAYVVAKHMKLAHQPGGSFLAREKGGYRYVFSLVPKCYWLPAT